MLVLGEEGGFPSSRPGGFQNTEVSDCHLSPITYLFMWQFLFRFSTPAPLLDAGQQEELFYMFIMQFSEPTDVLGSHDEENSMSPRDVIFCSSQDYGSLPPWLGKSCSAYETRGVNRHLRTRSVNYGRSLKGSRTFVFSSSFWEHQLTMFLDLVSQTGPCDQVLPKPS